VPGQAGLERFVAAQAGGVFDRALAELTSGQKRSHWMWFVFPQIAGLGRSETARLYAIVDRREAAEYLAHPLLGPRLDSSTRTILAWSGRRSAEAILGTIDAIKLRSSMTLFEAVAAPPHPFGAVLEAFYGGTRDPATLGLLD
jgi:uncharacterized protein (DUF1810 family)